MTARRKARKRALDVLYEAELRGLDPAAVLVTNAPSNPYTGELVEGVLAHAAEIDRRIDDAAVGWSIERMPAVDRNLLRVAAWELLFAADVPNEVAISEAVDLARDLSTDDSPAFVNGVLATIAESVGC